MNQGMHIASSVDESLVALRSELGETRATVVTAERRAQTAEEQCVIQRKQTEASRRACATAESDAAEARRQRDAAENNARAEREARAEAELHATELEALVGKLQRQRDAAEAMMAQLKSTTPPPLPARGAGAGGIGCRAVAATVSSRSHAGGQSKRDAARAPVTSIEHASISIFDGTGDACYTAIGCSSASTTCRFPRIQSFRWCGKCCGCAGSRRNEPRI